MTRRITLLLAVLALSLAFGSCRQSAATLPADSLQENALKLLVKQDGLYRITAEDVSRVLDLESVDLEEVRLATGGKAVAVLIDGDALLFYGQAPTSRYIAARPYVLTWGDTPSPQFAAAPETGEEAPQLKTVRRVARFEENQVYKSSAFHPETNSEPWFWQTIQVGQQASFELTLSQVADGAGKLALRLWGATTNYEIENDHDLDVIVNDHRLETIRWDGETTYNAVVDLPAGTLREGVNSLLLDNTVEGATFLDITLLDWVEVTYNALPLPEADHLSLAGGHDGRLDVGAFKGSPLAVDVSDPLAPVRLPIQIGSSGGRFLALAPPTQPVIVGQDGFLEPETIAQLRRSNWAVAGSQADMIIVTTDELAPALTPLVETREAEGLSVALLPVGEIYDQFGFGEASPTSITAFLSFALENWAEPKPRYLFLVGEATYDFRDYLGKMPPNVVPTMLTPVAFSGETVSDARIADVDGDARPDLAVGRWPVADPDQVADLVDRTLAYEAGPAPSHALFTADGTSPEFSSFTDRLLTATAFPEQHTVRLYGADVTEVTARWNEGAWLVSYVGHGSTDMWGKDDVFTSEATADLAAGDASPPVVVQFTCLSGFFAHPDITSISETMLAAENGPVVTIAATSLTLSTSQEPFATRLLEALLDPSVERIGDALALAKAGLNVGNDNLREISDTFGLLGDPSAHIVRPSVGSEG